MGLVSTQVIRHERSRTYIFPSADANGLAQMTFDNVVLLGISDSGNHYLNYGEGGEKKTIVNRGWIGIDIDADAWTYPSEMNQVNCI